ncbi:Uncharacterized protein PCOAH_00015900 [Plasmodium coatneyi]|uniref:Uncharacterized protein n=1 Tax=Plasmodium coatneyi TaxID=208452 RepID=A0A1B1DX22_9APIC|nr:Uncharacterized protein PCOAH_00015900 [Plasmodium coatneyi]ANQ07304.1 Uncharacterized protein PCOAH_00015900 [Plasmodium coatneyi]
MKLACALFLLLAVASNWGSHFFASCSVDNSSVSQQTHRVPYLQRLSELIALSSYQGLSDKREEEKKNLRRKREDSDSPQVVDDSTANGEKVTIVTIDGEAQVEKADEEVKGDNAGAPKEEDDSGTGISLNREAWVDEDEHYGDAYTGPAAAMDHEHYGDASPGPAAGMYDEQYGDAYTGPAAAMDHEQYGDANPGPAAGMYDEQYGDAYTGPAAAMDHEQYGDANPGPAAGMYDEHYGDASPGPAAGMYDEQYGDASPGPAAGMYDEQYGDASPGPAAGMDHEHYGNADVVPPPAGGEAYTRKLDEQAEDAFIRFFSPKPCITLPGEEPSAKCKDMQKGNNKEYDIKVTYNEKEEHINRGDNKCVNLNINDGSPPSKDGPSNIFINLSFVPKIPEEVINDFYLIIKKLKHMFEIVEPEENNAQTEIRGTV